MSSLPPALARPETRTAPRAFPQPASSERAACSGREVLALPAEQLVAIPALLRRSELHHRSMLASRSSGGRQAGGGGGDRCAVTARQLVAGVGGATTSAWVPLFADPLAGPLWEADRPLPAVPSGDIPSVLYVLPAGHPLIRRHRASFSLRQRAANTCQACRLCTDLCPTAVQGTQPHLLMRAHWPGEPPKLGRDAGHDGGLYALRCLLGCPSGGTSAGRDCLLAFVAALPSDLAGMPGRKNPALSRASPTALVTCWLGWGLMGSLRRSLKVFTYWAANALSAAMLHGWGPAGVAFFRRGVEKKIRCGPSLRAAWGRRAV